MERALAPGARSTSARRGDADKERFKLASQSRQQRPGGARNVLVAHQRLADQKGFHAVGADALATVWNIPRRRAFCAPQWAKVRGIADIRKNASR